MTSSDAEASSLGRSGPTTATALVNHIVSLDAAGVIDTGDCKESYGADTGDELTNYITYVRNTMPWATVNPGFHAAAPILPGNHDEILDVSEGTMPTATDFSLFTSRLWNPPFHFTCDWHAPRIRFIVIHSYIQHSVGGLAGLFNCDQSEIDWLRAQIDDMPAGWRTLVCSHAPANTAFGNEIRAELGGTNLRALLATKASKIIAYLNGHRHANMNTSVLNGITHFNGGAVSYTAGNGNGGFMPITYDPDARTLTFDYRYARTPFARYAGYTPVVISLPEIPSGFLPPRSNARGRSANFL
jgi:hypothetical protein